jgi:hypothetical protein
VGLASALAKHFGSHVSEEDVAAYVYGVLSCSYYAQKFWKELETPGPRVPITKDVTLFNNVVEHGYRRIWLQTFSERFTEKHGHDVPKGCAKNIAPIPSDAAGYPESFSFDEAASEISVGAGRFGPVLPSVWNFEVSGLKVVQSWLSYRMREKAGKKTSPLDKIQPKVWSPRMTDEFLELLWVVEATINSEPESRSYLEAVLSGPCFNGDELPKPTADQQAALAEMGDAGGLLALMADDDDQPAFDEEENEEEEEIEEG